MIEALKDFSRRRSGVRAMNEPVIRTARERESVAIERERIAEEREGIAAERETDRTRARGAGGQKRESGRRRGAPGALSSVASQRR